MCRVAVICPAGGGRQTGDSLELDCKHDQLGRPQTGPPARCGSSPDKSVGYPDTPSREWLSRRPFSAVTGTFCALLSGAIPEVYLSKIMPIHQSETRTTAALRGQLKFPGIREIIRELIQGDAADHHPRTWEIWEVTSTFQTRQMLLAASLRASQAARRDRAAPTS